MIASSRDIAALSGPVLVAVTASEIVNPHVWDSIITPVTYQSGLLLFVAGLAIVRAHNRWTASWPVVVTLVGWFGIVAGLARMFVTDLAQSSAPAMALPFEVILLAIGLFLTFKGYSSDQSTTGRSER